MTTGHRSMTVLPSRDVGAAISFWRDKLGFDLANKWGHEGQLQFAIMALGKITVALQRVERFDPGNGWSAYLYVSEAQAMADAIKAKDVTLEHDCHETFYGMLEFDLRTPDGHGIAFGQDLDTKGPEPGL